MYTGVVKCGINNVCVFALIINSLIATLDNYNYQFFTKMGNLQQIITPIRLETLMV